MISKALYTVSPRLLAHTWLGLAQAYSEQLIALRSSLTYPSLLAQCFLIAGEDHRHRFHPGYDLFAIARASYRRVRGLAREGASTVDQQVVRVLTNRFEPTIARKCSEIALAATLVRHFGKAEMPAVYLRIGYFGWRMDGYFAACRRLGYDATSLSLVQAAALVARLKYPEPRVNTAKRQAQIAGRTRYLLDLYQRFRLTGAFEHVHTITTSRFTYANIAAASGALPAGGPTSASSLAGQSA